MSSSARIRFESFEVCPQERQLWKHGTKLKLHGQPFQILVMLLERPGEILTREDIRKRLWPAETFVDFEHSVNTAIKKLRQALGDSAQVSRYVETLPGVGYRFISQVQKQPDSMEIIGVPLPTAVEVAAKPRAHANLWYRVVLGTAVTVLVFVSLAYYFFYPLPVPRAVRITDITHSGKVDAWGGLVFDGAAPFLGTRRRPLELDANLSQGRPGSTFRCSISKHSSHGHFAGQFPASHRQFH